MSLEHQPQPDLIAVLKDKLKESGRSINAVAKGAGVTTSAIAHAFKHNTGMNIRNYQKIAEELGLSVIVVEAESTSENGVEDSADQSPMFTD